MITVYTLQENNIIYYVGITRMKLNERLWYHKNNKDCNLEKRKWLQNKNVTIILSSTHLTVNEACEEEKRLILECKTKGLFLFNIEKGGGVSEYYKGIEVDMYNIEGVYIKSFISSKEAARYIGKNCHKEILNCCKGVLSQSHKHVWRYKNEPFNKYPVLKVNEVQSKVIVSKLSISIERYDKLGNLLEIHPSFADVVRKSLGNAGSIRKGYNNKLYDFKIIS